MADTKLEIKIGGISFAAEGPGDWLAKQLDKVLIKLPELVRIAPDIPEAGTEEPKAIKPKVNPTSLGTLASFLKEKKATSNQVRKYLATATWLHDTQGKSRLTTTDVTSALNTHNQGRLGNPAQCLIRNAEKGWVVKDGKKEFYVADEGRAELDK